MFLNLNSYVDFYSEALIEHREKYQYHIKDKVSRHQEISKMCAEFLDTCAKSNELYRVKYGIDNFLSYRWAQLINYFIPTYYEYLEECQTNHEPTNFRILSDNHFKVFLERAMVLRNQIGFDEFNSEYLVGLASKIRKNIFEIEMYSVQYAENIKYYYDEYFNENAKDFKELNKITEKLKGKIIINQ